MFFSRFFDAHKRSKSVHVPNDNKPEHTPNKLRRNRTAGSSSTVKVSRNVPASVSATTLALGSLGRRSAAAARDSAPSLRRTASSARTAPARPSSIEFRVTPAHTRISSEAPPTAMRRPVVRRASTTPAPAASTSTVDLTSPSSSPLSFVPAAASTSASTLSSAPVLTTASSSAPSTPGAVEPTMLAEFLHAGLERAHLRAAPASPKRVAAAVTHAHAHFAEHEAEVGLWAAHAACAVAAAAVANGETPEETGVWLAGTVLADEPEPETESPARAAPSAIAKGKQRAGRPIVVTRSRVGRPVARRRTTRGWRVQQKSYLRWHHPGQPARPRSRTAARRRLSAPAPAPRSSRGSSRARALSRSSAGSLFGPRPKRRRTTGA